MRFPTARPNQQPQLSLTQLPECIPQVFDREVVVEQVATMFSEAATQMPSQYDIGPRFAPGTRFGPTFNGQRIGVEMLNTSLLLLAAITIGVWVIGALIGGRTGRGRWSRLGGLLLAGSIAVLAIGLFVYVFGAALLPQAWFADLGRSEHVRSRSVQALRAATRAAIFDRGRGAVYRRGGADRAGCAAKTSGSPSQYPS